MTANATVHLPNSLTAAQVTKLTDAASELFRVSYNLERKHKQAAKDRLAAELSGLDLLGPGEHYRSHEDYVPGGEAA